MENDHLQMEMAAGSYVIAMTGPGDTQEGMNRLLNALRNLDKRLDEVLQGNREPDKSLDEVLSGNRKTDAATMKKDPGFCRHPLIPAERVVESAKVKGRKGLALPWQEVVGKVSLELFYLYPRVFRLLYREREFRKKLCSRFWIMRRMVLPLKERRKRTDWRY